MTFHHEYITLDLLHHWIGFSGDHLPGGFDFWQWNDFHLNELRWHCPNFKTSAGKIITDWFCLFFTFVIWKVLTLYFALIPIQIGYDTISSTHYGSLRTCYPNNSIDIVNLKTSSNVNVQGRWAFLTTLQSTSFSCEHHVISSVYVSRFSLSHMISDGDDMLCDVTAVPMMGSNILFQVQTPQDWQYRSEVSWASHVFTSDMGHFHW